MPTTIEITPTLFAVGDNGATFSTQKRYVRKSAAVGYALVAGETMAGRIDGISTSNNRTVSWHFRIPGYATFKYNGFNNLAASTPSPTVENVTI